MFFFFQIMGLFLLGLSIAVRMDSVLEEWLDILDIRVYYIGVYVLIFIALLIIVVPIFSCIAVYQEIMQLLLIVRMRLLIKVWNFQNSNFKLKIKENKHYFGSIFISNP